MRVRAAIFVLLAAFLAPARAEPPAPKELPRDEWPLQEKINAAIDRGVAWLKKSQEANGSWAGEFGSAGQTGLALFTLVSSGVPKGDPASAKAAAYLEGLDVRKGTVQDVMADRPPGIRMTYAHSLLVLALVARDPEAHRKAIRRSVQILVSEQKPSGQWAYTVSMGGPLDHGDNSNTQFALLALRRAARAGLPVPRAVWQRAYRHYASTAGEDGGWGYGCPGTMDGSYGSMTAVGVASLVICRSMLLGEAKAPGFAYLKVPEIARGVVWLEDRFAADRHPGIGKVQVAGPGGGAAPAGMPAMSDRTFQFYWLYAVERVGMLLGLRYVGSHDWYKEGSEWLVANQAADGSWSNAAGSPAAPEPTLASTCFALLFLERATLPVVTPGEGR